MDSKCCSEKTSHRLPRHSSLGDGRKGKTFLEGVEEEKSSERLRLLKRKKKAERLRVQKCKKSSEGSIFRRKCLREFKCEVEQNLRLYKKKQIKEAPVPQR